MEKINFKNLLKSHIGETFYCSIVGNVELMEIHDNVIFLPLRFKILDDCSGDHYINLSEYGKFNPALTDGECILFPSKEQRNWDEWIELNSYKETAIQVGDYIKPRDSNEVYRVDDFTLDGVNCHKYDNRYEIYNISLDFLHNECKIVEPKDFLKPFDKIIAIDDNSSYEYTIDMFIRYLEDVEEYKYEGFHGFYRKVLPYAGNEHLLKNQ
uniref:Uncharacterized protein n=1 Tax=Dulem virus 42 TaxID=3145760 RepID=A0AAU8BAE5_9CAUD